MGLMNGTTDTHTNVSCTCNCKRSTSFQSMAISEYQFLSVFPERNVTSRNPPSEPIRIKLVPFEPNHLASIQARSVFVFFFWVLKLIFCEIASQMNSSESFDGD